ncbi:MAG: hypothetical protein KDH15_20850 [Rhodocyclaceae bacterium]|nr:hypothetical protein [Rhodocyclaceae bacterium]
MAALLAWGGAAPAALPQIEFSAARIRHRDVVAEGVSLTVGGETGAGARLRIAKLARGDRSLAAVDVGCGSLLVAGRRLSCRHGRLAAERPVAPLDIDFEFDTATLVGEGRLSAADDGQLRIVGEGQGRWRLTLQRLALASLPVPDLPAGWRLGGRLDGTLTADHSAVEFALELGDGHFSNADGTRAGEDIELAVRGDAQFGPGGVNARVAAQWRRGGVFLMPLYRSAPLALSGRWRRAAEGPGRLDLDVEGDGWRALSIAGVGDSGADVARWQWRVQWREADLAGLGPSLVAPWLDQAAPETWQFAGAVSGSAEWHDGRLVGTDLALRGLGLGNPPRGLAIGPVDGALRWGHGIPTAGRLSVSGLRWRKLAFGDFELALAGSRQAVVVDSFRVPVVDGALVVERLHWQDEGGGPTLAASAYVEPLSMEALTEALDWPRMSGRLSASLPGLRYRDRVLGVDGKLVVGVFGGYVEADGLRVVEPFGPAPTLHAEIRARHLDLGLLTDTFSFGHIAGQLDFDVAGLEARGWRPQVFDAWLRSSPGDYPRRISQRAVENISALGGAGATAALQRSFLGLFETFGYKRLGLGCRLRSGVCEMRGLGEDRGRQGYLIVEGGGLPALNVIGYNRRVDWSELLDRVAAVIESNAEPEVR